MRSVPDVHVDSIRKVLIAGAGTMGLQIAFQCAAHGFDVLLHDSDPGALETADERLRSYCAELLAAEALGPTTVGSALQRVAHAVDLDEAFDVDLVSESIPEDPVRKGRVFAELDAICPEGTIFTTNTSTLVPSMFADATGRPDRFAALHFHQPVWISNVVDVMAHPGTAPKTTELLVGFARQIGQSPILVRTEHGGYVFNAMYNAMNREAITLVANSVASVEDVDRAWMGVTKMPIGPFGMLDVVGLDTVWDITRYWAECTADAQLAKNAAFLPTYVERGALGRKAGEGFYRYPDPAFASPGFLG